MTRTAVMMRVVALAAALATTLPATARAAFDDLEVSPRAVALGGSWAAVLGDEYAPFHNPASLAWVRGAGAGASYLRPYSLDFVSQSAAAASIALPRRLGGAGLGLRRFGVDWLGENLTSETTISLAHGFHLVRDRQSELAVGWAVSVYALDYGRSVTGLDPGNATSVGLSAGAVAVVRERTRVGIRAANLNNPNIGDRDKDELRRSISIGVSYAPYPGVETVLDIANDLGGTAQYRGGAEFAVTDFLRLRAGIRTEPQAFTAGVGLSRSGLSLDYGFSTGGVLGESHQFGIRAQLPGSRQE
jgi:hypothetical protein